MMLEAASTMTKPMLSAVPIAKARLNISGCMAEAVLSVRVVMIGSCACRAASKLRIAFAPIASRGAQATQVHHIVGGKASVQATIRQFSEMCLTRSTWLASSACMNRNVSQHLSQTVSTPARAA
jgi:hypothetical protein